MAARDFNRVWEREIAPAMELPFAPEDCGPGPRQERRRQADADQDAFNRIYLSSIFRKPTAFIHRAIDTALQTRDNTCLWAPRGIGKSTRGEAVILRMLLLEQIFYVPYLMKTEDKALEALSDLHIALTENPKVLADYAVDEVKFSGTQLEVHLGGEWRCVEAFGMGGSIRGSKYRTHRPNLIFIDDPHKDEEARNPEQLEKTYKWLGRNVLFLGELGETAPVKVLMTRIAEDDLFGQLERAREQAVAEGRPFRWELIGLPIAEPDGRSNCPEILSDEQIAERRAEDPASVDQEWFGIVADRKGKYFADDGWVYYEPANLMGLRLRKRMSVDPSLGRTKRSDTSCVGVFGYTLSSPREYYVLHADIGRRAPPAIARAMFDAYQVHRDLELIVIEDVGFQEAAIQPEFFRLCAEAGIEPPPILLYHPTENKDSRIGLIARPHSQRRIHYSKGHRLFNQQCQRYPMLHGKDGPDCFAQFLITAGGEQFTPLKITYTPLVRRRSERPETWRDRPAETIQYGDGRERSAW